MPIITAQKLIDADKDADSLDIAISGGDRDVVRTRRGKTYPTMPNAIRQIMENGGFRPFATEAELKAYSPTVTPSAAKALDTKKIWLWDGAEWSDTGESELDRAKEFTENSVQQVRNDIELNVTNTAGSNIFDVRDAENKTTMYLDRFSKLFLFGIERAVQDYLEEVDSLSDKIKSGSFKNENLAEFSDALENIYALFDKKAGLFLTGLDGSVQENLAGVDAVKKSIQSVLSRTANLSEFRDDSQNLYAYFNSQSELFLSKLNNSVQAFLNSDNLSAKSNSYVHDSKSLVANVVQQYVVSCLSSGGVIAPVPFSQAPHNFTPPAELINAKIEQGERLIIDTVYQKDDGVVHPHVLEFRNGFLGYRYILGLTPYYLTQDKYENPCIYGSHDLENFELIDKFPQPFSERPVIEHVGQKAYNSDDFFTYDFYTGELLFCWRRSYEGKNGRNEIWGKRTKNGLEWTNEELIFDGKLLGGVLLSPSVIFNFETGLFELYVVEATSSGWRIRRMNSPTLKNPKWTHSKYFQAIPGANSWHLDVRWIGNKIMCIAHDDAMTGVSSTKNLYIGMYDQDSDVFSWSSKVISGEHYDPYKATFTPILDLENNTIALQVLWSSRSGGDENMWKLYSSKSNSFKLN